MSSILKTARRAAIVCPALVLLLSVSAQAADLTAKSTTAFCFSQEDFTEAGSESPDGIFLTCVPSAQVGTIQYGSRTLCAGDVLPAEALGSLTLQPACDGGQDAVLSYLPVTNGRVGDEATLTVSILAAKNEPPEAAGTSLQTYKNIPISSVLKASDPENGKLTYSVVAEPKRGTLVIEDDGSFTYTPDKNKVGKDSFAFVVTDEAGNSSEQATVSIQILKPSSKATYADMTDDPDQFVALWLLNNGIFTGEQIGERTCFNPDAQVSRGEFLVMTMRALNLDPADSELTSGFSDESETPAWMRPYIVAALENGVVSGVTSGDGLVFRPAAAMTRAEAAVLLDNILNLPAAGDTETFADSDAVPAWAASAVSSMESAALMDAGDTQTVLTRREAARMLYAVSRYESESDGGESLLSWAK